MEPNRIADILERADIRLVRFLYCDNGCVIRGKVTHVNRLATRMTAGIGLTVAMQAMNMLDQLQAVDGMGPVGEVRMVPDPESLVLLPYAPQSAAMLCDLITQDHQPWGACPRSFLRRMVAQAAAAGLTIQASQENEFNLLKPTDNGAYTPLDHGLYASTTSMTAAAVVIHDIIHALEAQGIAMNVYHPELAAGQNELSIQHGPVLQAADQQIWFRETVRNVAHAHGLVASLAPKPLPDQAGNSSHIHWSIWDAAGEVNLLYEADAPDQLSQVGRHFVGGVLAHTPGLLALTAPSFNSYRHLQPHFWSSAFTCWGPENREACVRLIPGGWEHAAETINLEFKASDSSNNPYLALGGLIAAGLDGIARKLDPGEPTLIDPGNYSDSERATRGIQRYPTTQLEALDALAQDDVLLAALGAQLSQSYLAVKRSEYAAFAAENLDFEIAHHIAKF